MVLRVSRLPSSADKLHALGFAARERSSGLAKFQITQANLFENLQTVMQPRNVFEEFHGFFDRHLEDVVNILAFIFHFERFAVETFAFADIARHINRRQEVHFDRDTPWPSQFSQRPPGTLKLNLPGL
jgi:hypothetical protein